MTSRRPLTDFTQEQPSDQLSLKLALVIAGDRLSHRDLTRAEHIERTLEAFDQYIAAQESMHPGFRFRLMQMQRKRAAVSAETKTGSL